MILITLPSHSIIGLTYERLTRDIEILQLTREIPRYAEMCFIGFQIFNEVETNVPNGKDLYSGDDLENMFFSSKKYFKQVEINHNKVGLMRGVDLEPNQILII